MCKYEMDLMSIVEDAASWLPIPLSHIGSQVKRWQSQKLQILKIRQNFKFLNFETGITRDTPSEVAW